MRTTQRFAFWVVLFAIIAFLIYRLAWAPSAPPLAANQKVDSILVLKRDHVLELISSGRVIRSYRVSLGRGGLAPKEREGDERTPEGHYVIDARNSASRFYKALHISYPDANDRERATKLGVSPGGAIMIHGLPDGLGWLGAAHRLYDWTSGCVAVTDAQMDEIWKVVPVGTPIEIRP
ncbi:MAG TPA: L,D-transpeptidase family protein [Terracidiphilus sp.]|nr:L,D-transpeptidase family protein [Terracidiphilus sp.]